MLRVRRGERIPPPRAVVFPSSTEEVASVLAWAVETGTAVVPRGGGSGLAGGAQSVRRGIVMDLSRMNRVLSVDDVSLAAHVEAGVRGDHLEQELARRRLTLGHHLPSLAISTVGGWIAGHSAGLASAGYGAIEDVLLGLTAAMSTGEVMELRPTPRSAAGPDLRRLFVGSEGTLGVITGAVLSVSPMPEGLRWAAFRPSGFEEGMSLARAVAQRGLRPLVVALHDEAEAVLMLSEAGHDRGPVLLLGFDQGSVLLRETMQAIELEASFHDARTLSPTLGAHWWQHRDRAVDAYRRAMGPDRALGEGAVMDGMEVAGLWRGLPGLYRSVREAIAGHAESVGCRLSHPHRSGADLSFTFVLRAPDDVAAEERYLQCWRDVAAASHGAGGTITHHRGVGL
ncbi:MAG: FAD-binding oxidoreductase, partial [Actinomycetota bacterium]|nr:FAD-binding oxidoreductase [Actinomycetota bacterium]